MIKFYDCEGEKVNFEDAEVVQLDSHRDVAAYNDIIDRNKKWCKHISEPGLYWIGTYFGDHLDGMPVDTPIKEFENLFGIKYSTEYNVYYGREDGCYYKSYDPLGLVPERNPFSNEITCDADFLCNESGGNKASEVIYYATKALNILRNIKEGLIANDDEEYMEYAECVCSRRCSGYDE